MHPHNIGRNAGVIRSAKRSFTAMIYFNSDYLEGAHPALMAKLNERIRHDEELERLRK